MASYVKMSDIATDHEIKRGTRALFVTQIFSTLSFAILYSTLTLFGTQVLKLPTDQVLALTGSFLAFNYGLHFLGGYMGGRLISNRLLFSISMGIQVIAALFLVGTVMVPFDLRLTFMMLGLAIFLTGSGLNVTCMNCMVTQLFDDPSDVRREKAFLWNYSGMNVGFFIGFDLAGHYTLTNNYGMLFGLGGVANIIAIVLIVINWRVVRDRDTFLTEGVRSGKMRNSTQFYKGFGVIIITIIVMMILIHHADISNAVISLVFLITIVAVLFLAANRKDSGERARMVAYVFLLIAAFVFWVLYQLAPLALMYFLEYNIKMSIAGIQIAPQWVSNINTIVIVVGGPIMAWVLQRARAKGKKVSLPFLFGLALIFIGVGFGIFPIGIRLAGAGLVGFSWVFWSYILQSIGELCISPIGYSAIGRLAPKHLQNIMMGLWCMMTGVAAIGASYLSQLAVGKFTAEQLQITALTNPHYSQVFGWVGIISIIVGFIMFIFMKQLNGLIDHAEISVGELGAVSMENKLARD
ncbi:MAG: oligopeptide:H+ symporter [Fusobacteria bacterium]|nr:oligopeptide:H+ symporter [Fusobacteriota bacterium]